VKGHVQVNVVWSNIPCVAEVLLEDGRSVRLPGWWKRNQFRADWARIAPEDVEQTKAALVRGDVVVSFE